jgi:hypothetical protein
VLQVSVVQGLPSSHCGFVVQHPATGVCVHAFVVVSHASVVQLVLSMQSPGLSQQVLIGLELQFPVARLQLSAVHTSPSLQSASELQQPVCAVWLQV